jgi:hypothetical protein
LLDSPVAAIAWQEFADLARLASGQEGTDADRRGQERKEGGAPGRAPSGTASSSDSTGPTSFSDQWTIG